MLKEYLRMLRYKGKFQTNFTWWFRHLRTMTIDNPSSPPFRKGGMGGFETFFLCKGNE